MRLGDSPVFEVTLSPLDEHQNSAPTRDDVPVDAVALICEAVSPRRTAEHGAPLHGTKRCPCSASGWSEVTAAVSRFVAGVGARTLVSGTGGPRAATMDDEGSEGVSMIVPIEPAPAELRSSGAHGHEPYDEADTPAAVGTPSRARKIVTRIGIGIAALIVTYLVLVAVSWLMVDAHDDLEFFGERSGDNHPLVFAHQGGEGRWPSNTMVGFRESLAVGADVLDADMHMSRDGELVLIHDETVDRTSDGTGEVRDLTLPELRELDFGYRFSSDGGATFPYRGMGVGIVTTDELFAEFIDTRFGIEIKQTEPEAATKLCSLIRRYGYEDRVLVSSFAQATMDAFRDACPDVATSATDGEAKRFYIFQLLRLSGFYSPPFDSLQVPEYRDGTHVLTGSFVGAADRWNLPLVPWTINDVDDFDRIIADFDVDGINTNYPDRLVEYLESR